MNATPPAYVVFLAVAAATWLSTFPTRAVLGKLGIVDRPNARSSHEAVTIRGAGVAIIMVVSAAMAIAARHAVELWPILGLFVVLAVVSFTDDIKGLPAKLRFAVHAAAAVTGAAIAFRSGAPLGLMVVLIATAAWLWIAGYTNAFNFMDGINGIAGMQALVTGLGTGLVSLQLGLQNGEAVVFIAFAVAGAALGFLPHNFPRARVFMGDVGSAPLGFLLATLTFWIAELTSWWVLFWIGLMHANFVLDTGITLIRRAQRGDRLHEAHREHFYQRLVRAGYSHAFVTLTEAALQCVVVVALWAATPASVGIKIAAGFGIIGLWLAFFSFAERKFRAFERARSVAGAH